jgi:hypothetical protein
MSGGFGGGISKLRTHEMGIGKWQVSMNISRESGGIGGIVSTYGKSAITKAPKTQNPQLACESDKIGGRDVQIVKGNCMLHCLIGGSTYNFSAMDNG